MEFANPRLLSADIFIFTHLKNNNNVNHKKVKKLQETYIAKQNLKPRDLVSVVEMAQSPQVVSRYRRKQEERIEQAKMPSYTRAARILREESVIIKNIRAISPGAPTHIF